MPNLRYKSASPLRKNPSIRPAFSGSRLPDAGHGRLGWERGWYKTSPVASYPEGNRHATCRLWLGGKFAVLIGPHSLIANRGTTAGAGGRRIFLLLLLLGVCAGRWSGESPSETLKQESEMGDISHQPATSQPGSSCLFQATHAAGTCQADSQLALALLTAGAYTVCTVSQVLYVVSGRHSASQVFISLWLLRLGLVGGSLNRLPLRAERIIICCIGWPICYSCASPPRLFPGVYMTLRCPVVGSDKTYMYPYGLTPAYLP
jgi:hypothetical protein